MATKTKKPVKAKKPIAAKKVVVKKPVAVKDITKKPITVKPPVKAKPIKKTEKKGLPKVKMTKVVIDRFEMATGEKIFVKAAKRPAAKKSAKKTK